MKIRPVVAELSHADGQTHTDGNDAANSQVTFRNFVNAPRNEGVQNGM